MENILTVIDELGSLLSKYKDEIKYPVMVKPCDGSGSRGASRVDYAKILLKHVSLQWMVPLHIELLLNHLL